MKEYTDRWLSRALLSASLTVLSLAALAQTGTEAGTSVTSAHDSTGCRNNITLYKAGYSGGNLSEALHPWRLVLAGCPDSSEDIYIDGEAMYRDLYSKTGDLAYIDTILMVLTQRTYYFGNRSGNDLHKADLLFELAGDDPEYLGLCYNILAETAESHADQMACSHFVLMATAAASLYGMEIIGPEELEHAFVISVGTIESRLENKQCDAGYSDDLTNLEMYFTTCGAMTCNSLEMLYAQRVESNFRDREFIDKVFMMLTETGCTASDLYYNVAVKLFANDRTAENAVRLAELNIERNNIEKAISYFTEAYNRDTSRLVRSEVLTRVAVMELGQGKRQEARDRAEHAWELNKRNARALMILADCYAGAELGNSFDNHTAYWVAVDYLEAAVRVDPSLKKEADPKIRAYSQLFPTREECFYRKILDEGTVFNVGGWIGEVTRVRFRRE